MTRTPDVSVVIPTRNRWSLLEEALVTALGQRDVAVEVIVVDDASEDGTAERVHRLGDDRLRVIRQDVRQGVARARNAGIAEARGPWVAFLDDDDLWSPSKLRLQLAAAERNAASFAYGASALINVRGAVTAVLPAPDPATIARQLLVENVVPGGCSNAIARTDLVRAVGGFDSELYELADWDLWIRVTREGPAAACPEPVVGYLRHADNMLVRDRPDVIREFAYLEDKHREASRASGTRFDRSAMMRWAATECTRAGHRRLAARMYARGAVAYHDPTDLLRALSYARPQTGLKRLVRGSWSARARGVRPSPTRVNREDGRIGTWLDFAGRNEADLAGAVETSG